MAEESKQESSASPSRWSELLPELLSRLTLHLYKGGDVRAVVLIPSICKSWNSLMDVSYTARLIRTSLLPYPPPALSRDYPCLFAMSKGTLCKFYHPHHTFTMDFPELSRSCIQFSKFGWLLLRRLPVLHIDEDEDDYFSYFFFNPFTREKIELPPLECEYGFHGMCFSAPPTCSDCYVIGLGRPNDGSYFGIVKRGEQQWTIYEPDPDTNYISQSHLVLYEDRCYAIGYENKTRVFDIKEEMVQFVGTLFPSLVDTYHGLNTTSKFLVSDGEQMLGVIRSHGQQEISIARWNKSNQEWVDISTDHLSNKMLFLSKTSSLLLPAPVKAASNKVYFPKILNDASFVPYCLETTKYISFLADYSSPTPCDHRIKEWSWSKCTWIETMPFLATPSSKRTIDW